MNQTFLNLMSDVTRQACKILIKKKKKQAHKLDTEHIDRGDKHKSLCHGRFKPSPWSTALVQLHKIRV